MPPHPGQTRTLKSEGCCTRPLQNRLSRGRFCGGKLFYGDVGLATSFSVCGQDVVHAGKFGTRRFAQDILDYFRDGQEWRSARNAATATSSAAFKAQGNAPPFFMASRASRKQGKRRVETFWKSRRRSLLQSSSS